MNEIAKKPMFRGVRLAAHVALQRRATTVSQVRISTDPRFVNKSIRAAVVKGTYELAERRLLESTIRPNDKVLELGAGIGLISLLSTRLAGAGNVVSYEANELMKPVIDENFRLNGQVPNVVYRAVTATGEDVEFFRASNVISSSMFDRDIGAEKVRVQSVSLAAILRSVEPDVLIMDVEGTEIDLIPEVRLHGVRDIVLELHPHIIGTDQCEHVQKCLVDDGFVLRATLDKNVLYSRG